MTRVARTCVRAARRRIVGKGLPRLALMVLAGIGSTPVHPAETGADDRALLEEVLVTGTRIPLPLAETTGPVVILTTADIERAQSDSLGKVLQALPLQNGPTTNADASGSSGDVRINLRGLGDSRTLVLLNGRRFIFGGLGADSSVDLNSIPLAMVERVEIVASGWLQCAGYSIFNLT